jgi:hypothetical protein
VASSCSMAALDRQGDKVKLAATLEFDEPPGGRFAGLFEVG